MTNLWLLLGQTFTCFRRVRKLDEVWQRRRDYCLLFRKSSAPWAKYNKAHPKLNLLTRKNLNGILNNSKSPEIFLLATFYCYAIKYYDQFYAKNYFTFLLISAVITIESENWQNNNDKYYEFMIRYIQFNLNFYATIIICRRNEI